MTARAMHSIWEIRQFHRTPDVVVIGAGIVGLFSALFHKRRFPHHHVVVVERGPFPSGASMKNAGFACFGSPSELLEDEDHEGTDAMLARVEARWNGLRELRTELGDVAIGYEPTGGHEIYPEHSPLYTCVAERFDALNATLSPILGPEPFKWANDAIASNGLQGIGHMVRTDLEGPIDTGKLMSRLLQKVLSEGVLIRSNSNVVRIEDGPEQVVILLADGTTLTTAWAVVCTNGYTTDLLPELPVVPARGQVLLTAPIDGLKLRGTFHYDAGFYYFRDFAGGVLVGGGRNLDIVGERTMLEQTTPVIQNALEELLRTVILPDRNFTVAQRWSGIMCVGPSRAPIVERHRERVVTAVRLGGMGVAIGIRVARQAAALIGE